jgi:hypothetical protein
MRPDADVSAVILAEKSGKTTGVRSNKDRATKEVVDVAELGEKKSPEAILPATAVVAGVSTAMENDAVPARCWPQVFGSSRSVQG